MAMTAVTTRAQMRAQLAQYRRNAHPTKAHNDVALGIVFQLWRQARREKADLWDTLSKYEHVTHKSVTGASLKRAFRTYLDGRQNGRCCYCRHWLVNNANAKPIEHILPKIEYPQFSVHFWNLAVACTDCNLAKLKDVWGSISEQSFCYPGHHAFPDMFHPRFHAYDEHVRYVIVETNSGGVSLYEGRTAQGRHLCINLLNKVATKRTLVENNPELKKSMSTIVGYQAKLAGISTPRFAEFAELLNESVLGVLKD